MTVPRNLIQDRWRTRKETVSFEEDHPAVPASPFPDPEQDLMDGEIAGRIQEALMHLSESNREAFVLRYVDDLSYEEVGEILGVSVAAARVRAHRACKELQSHLMDIRPYVESQS